MIGYEIEVIAHLEHAVVARVVHAAGMTKAQRRHRDARKICGVHVIAVAVFVGAQRGHAGCQAFHRQALFGYSGHIPENLAPGPRPYTWPSRWALNLAVRDHDPAVAGGVTVEPTFYYPAWQVRCGGTLVPTFPAPQTQLLSYRGSGCEKRLVMTAPERWGAAISLAALLLLIAATFAAPRLRRRREPPIGGGEEVTR